MTESRSCPHPESAPVAETTRPDLAAEGWTRRFIADPIRAREALEMYPRMGFEVRAEPMRATEVGPECATCPSVTCPLYLVIYTRRKPS